TDRRRVHVSLTEKGRRAYRALDRRSRDDISAMLSDVPAPRRARLLEAVRDVERILHDSATPTRGDVLIRTHQIGDIGWAIERHGQLYSDEYGWNEEFEALVARLFARFASEHDENRERCWIAELDGRRVGCVFVVRNDEDSSAAQLRCLLVEPEGRGLGIGRRLVDECVTFARSAGYRRMILWTNDVLLAARRIYEACGFALVREERHRSFGHDLIGQFWALDLV